MSRLIQLVSTKSPASVIFYLVIIMIALVEITKAVVLYVLAVSTVRKIILKLNRVIPIFTFLNMTHILLSTLANSQQKVRKWLKGWELSGSPCTRSFLTKCLRSLLMLVSFFKNYLRIGKITTQKNRKENYCLVAWRRNGLLCPEKLKILIELFSEQIWTGSGN